MERRPVTLDGLTPDEVLALPDDTPRALVLCGEPLVFRAGTADLLGAAAQVSLVLAKTEGSCGLRHRFVSCSC